MAKTKTRSPRALKPRARPPLSSLADELEVGLDELVLIVQRAASAQIALAKRRAKLLRYQRAAEECIRAFAAIEGNEKGAFELGRTLGVRPWGPDPRPQAKLDRKIREWTRDNPAIGADSPIELMRAFAADEGNKEVLEESSRSQFEPVKKPWVLSAIEACEGYAGDDEDLKTVESRILLEAGVSPNETAAFQDGGNLRSLREIADSAEARALKRQAVKLRAKLSTDLSTLKAKREPLVDGTIGALARAALAPTLRLLDEQIADLEAALAKLDSRRRF
jgi:hypothetical protein